MKALEHLSRARTVLVDQVSYLEPVKVCVWSSSEISVIDSVVPRKLDDSASAEASGNPCTSLAARCGRASEWGTRRRARRSVSCERRLRDPVNIVSVKVRLRDPQRVESGPDPRTLRGGAAKDWPRRLRVS